jgi:hypothetical protein
MSRAKLFRVAVVLQIGDAAPALAVSEVAWEQFRKDFARDD